MPKEKMTHRVPRIMNTRLKMPMAAAEMLYSEGDRREGWEKEEIEVESGETMEGR